MKRVPAGVVLAAGRSSRMGKPKALLHVGGRPALDGIVEAYAAASLSPIVVVASGEALERARTLPGVEAVPGRPDAPMIHSLALGLGVLDETVPSAVVQPVDAPFTTREMIDALLRRGPHGTRVLCHQGAAGHPVLVARSLFEEIDERPEGGLRAVLSLNEVEVVEWPDPRVLADLDTPEDLERWRSWIEAGLH